MIHASVIAIDQRVLFTEQGHEIQNHLVLLLPNGVEVRAPIDLEVAKQLLEAAAESTSDPQPSRPPPSVVPSVPLPTRVIDKEPTVDEVLTRGHNVDLEDDNGVSAEEVAQMEIDAGTIPWAQLPDNVLSPAMKAAFTRLGVAEQLSPAAIRSVEQEVREKFGREQWEEVLGPLASEMMPQISTPAPPTPPAAPQPALGQVQWADGTPIVAAPTRSRTVPKDDFGYPVLDDGTVDPGEVSGGPDADEDGVGQL
jgi:hypothetical protein